MGYFGRLQKTARYYDRDAGEYRWGAWKYTGSASAGADYVSADGLCVVYRAEVCYDASDTGLGVCAVATNFVNPNSSGNPSTARCYLYTFDPTGGLDAAVSAPPDGVYAISETVEFSASNVGDYIVFSLGSLGIKPDTLYFWFVSSNTYAVYGSNQIYHYATGNWNSSWQTGTRTPAVSGVFNQSSSSGGSETGTDYTVVDSGSFSSVYYAQSASLARAEKTASHIKVSFTGGGEVSFTAARTNGTDGSLRMDGYLTASSGFDTVNGLPTGTILARNEGGTSYGFDYTVAAGQTYYLWTVIHRAGYSETPVTVTAAPKSWCFTVVDKGTVSGVAQSQRGFSMSVGAYQVGRMKLDFAYTAQTEITVSSADEYSRLWVSEQADIDSSTGWPLESLAEIISGGSNYFTPERGRTYYVFAMYGQGAGSGSVSFTLTPEEKVWDAGDSAEYSLLDSELLRAVSLDEREYSVIKLSFAHSGTASFSSKGSAIASGQCLAAYLSESDALDNHYGDMASYLAYAEGGAETGESPEYDFSYDVVAGETYYLITKNRRAYDDESTALNTTIYVVPPAAPDYTLIESAESLDITAPEEHERTYPRYTISRRALRLRYRGEAELSAAATGGGAPQMKLYLTDSDGIDLKTGLPTGTIFASAESGEAGAAIKYEFADRTDYYVFLVVSEIYHAAECTAKLTIGCPEAQYFSVTETAERFAIDAETVYAAAPGESGIVRLELSFKKSGVVYFKTADAAGSLTFLRGWLSFSPDADAVAGAPRADIIVSGSGSESAADYGFSAPVEAGTTYYLFSRDDWLYGSPDFDIYIRPVPGVVRAHLGGEERSAAPFVYSGGAWRAAVPKLYTQGAWRTGG